MNSMGNFTERAYSEEINKLKSEILELKKEVKELTSENVRLQTTASNTYGNQEKDIIYSGILQSDNESLRMIQDMGAGKEIAQILLFERELFEGIFNNIPILITIYDPALNNFRFNRQMREVLGWTEEDAASGDILEMIYPDRANRAEVIDFMKSLLPGWKEFVTTSKKGERIETLWANILLTSGVQIGIGIDIRQRKRAEEKLRENEQRLQAIFNNAAIGIVEIDLSTRFLFANQRIIEILGYTHQELFGKTILEITAPEDVEQSDALFQSLHRGETNILNYEKRYLKADGSKIWIQASFSVIRGKNGNHLKSIGTIKDITERRKVEQALLESEERFRMLADNISQMAWILDYKACQYGLTNDGTITPGFRWRKCKITGIQW